MSPKFWSRLRALQTPLLVGAYIVVVVFGFIGAAEYLHALGQPPSVPEDAYVSLQCFVLNALWVPGHVAYPWPLEVARFSAPLLLAFTTILAVFVLFRQNVDIWLAKMRSDHVVVCGLGEEGIAVVRSLAQTGWKLVVVDRTPTATNVAEARRAGARVILGDARESDTLVRAGVRNAETVLVLCGGDAVNGEVLAAIDKHVVGQRARTLNVQVEIESIELVEQLLEHELRFGPRPGHIGLDYTCLPGMAAHRLLDRYPPGPEIAAWPRVVIFGSGPIPEALVICLAQTRTASGAGGRLAVCVVGPEAKDLWRSLLRRHPRIDQALDVAVYEDALDERGDGKGPVLRGGEAIYICLDEESNAIARGLALQVAPKPPLLIAVVTMQGLTLLEATMGAIAGVPSVNHFGVLDALCDPETLLGGFGEQLARAVHLDYVEHEAGKPGAHPGSLVPWAKLSPELRGQNRDQAQHYVRLLETLHLRAVPSLGLAGVDISFSDQEVEQLAELEHDRWMAQKRADGWSAPAPGGDRDTDAKLHPDLVPFSELDKDTQDKDRRVVRDMPRLLARFNFRLERVPAGESEAMQT